jgi:hypothetical protein
MDAARVTQALLELGLTIHSALRQDGYVITVRGGKTPSTGVVRPSLKRWLVPRGVGC